MITDQSKIKIQTMPHWQSLCSWFFKLNFFKDTQSIEGDGLYRKTTYFFRSKS